MTDEESKAEVDRLTALRNDEEEVAVIRLAKQKDGKLRMRVAFSKECQLTAPTPLQSVTLHVRDFINHAAGTDFDTTAYDSSGIKHLIKGGLKGSSYGKSS